MSDPFGVPWHAANDANHLALSLVNTLDWRRRESPKELLTSYSELLRWAWTVGALTPAEVKALKRLARAHARTTERVRRGAVVTREAMAELFLAAVEGRSVPTGALRTLDETSGAARAAQALRLSGDEISWRWRSRTPEPERPVWAAALAASDLLTSDALAQVRQCDDAECGWMFVDTSKNRSRRWCSMDSCGNRNKARSFYRRSCARGATRADRKMKGKR